MPTSSLSADLDDFGFACRTSSVVLSTLIESGAKWQDPVTKEVAATDRPGRSLVPPSDTSDNGTVFTTVRTLSGVRYGLASEQQSLDIVFPNDNDSALHIESNAPSKSPLLPVLLFVHGGGWVRGSRSNRLYGAPGVTENTAARGILSFSIGYRLGSYPDFLHDVSRAIRFILDRVESLGGDPSRIYLGGHSAGAHIASLLVLRHDEFLLPAGVPKEFLSGLILLSGVYDLFSPMKKAPLDAKNKWFVTAYVWPTFGLDDRTRRDASPLLLLNPDKDTSLLGSLPKRMFGSMSNIWQTDEEDGKEEDTKDVAETSPNKISSQKASDNNISAESTLSGNAAVDIRDARQGPIVNTDSLPPVLICNASVDMGLQENGHYMATALSQHTEVTYKHIPWTDHASICWSNKTAEVISHFVFEG